MRPTLSLPDGQDALIAAVAAANPHTIVVLETGGPVLMPWLDKAAAVLEAWYPGIKGADAIADMLFGDVNPSGRLPITFPASLDQLPRPDVPGWTAHAPAIDVDLADTTAASFDVDDTRRLRRRLSLVRPQGAQAAVSVRLRPLLHRFSTGDHSRSTAATR